jgi:thiamine biosynthesis lipoprotein
MKKLSRRDFIKISAIGAGALAIGGIGIKELLSQSELKMYSQTQAIMGTFVTVKAVDTDEANARGMVASTFDEINRLSGVFSRFDASSELYSLNSSGYLIGASGDMLEVMKKSIQYSEMTGGLFDVTALPLLELNMESFDRNDTPPESIDIAERKTLVGYKNISISGNNITLAKNGSMVTLDSIAVGYIVDKAASLLKREGMNNVLINGGGEIYPSGTKEDGEEWRIGIANPRGSGYAGIIDAGNWAVSTSGDYEAYFTDDYLYNYIIDPRTGVSPTELASATVIAKDTISADALSTACIIMGKDEALAMVEKLPRVEALLIDKNMNISKTRDFPEYISE